jgi:hypothetical protein
MLLYKDLQQLYSHYEALSRRIQSVEQLQAKPMTDASTQTNQPNQIPRPKSLIQLKNYIKAHEISANNINSRQHSNSAHSPLERSYTHQGDRNSVNSIASKCKTFDKEQSIAEINDECEHPHVPSTISARDLDLLNAIPNKCSNFNNIESTVASPIYANKNSEDFTLDNGNDANKYFNDTSASKLSYLKKIGLQEMAKHKISNTIKVHSRIKDNDDSQISLNVITAGLGDQNSITAYKPRMFTDASRKMSSGHLHMGVKRGDIYLGDRLPEKEIGKNISILEESKQKAKEQYMKELEMGSAYQFKGEKIKKAKQIAIMRREKIKNLSDQCRKAAANKRGVSHANKLEHEM